MRLRNTGLMIGLAAGGWLAAALGADLTGTPVGPARLPAPMPPPGGESCGCGTHGTAVAFLDTPEDAATRAKRDQKLVFVLHVSGHFETPEFT